MPTRYRSTRLRIVLGDIIFCNLSEIGTLGAMERWGFEHQPKECWIVDGDGRLLAVSSIGSVSSVCLSISTHVAFAANLSKLDEEFLVTLLMAPQATTTISDAAPTDSAVDTGVVVAAAATVGVVVGGGVGVVVRVGSTPLTPHFFLPNIGCLFRLLRSIPAVILVLACLDKESVNS